MPISRNSAKTPNSYSARLSDWQLRSPVSISERGSSCFAVANKEAQARRCTRVETS